MKTTKEYAQEIFAVINLENDQIREIVDSNNLIDYLKEPSREEDGLNERLLNELSESSERIYEKYYQLFLNIVDELIGAKEQYCQLN